MAYAIDQEKNNAAEVQTMLDSSFSILIRFSREGYITTVNKAATARLGQKAEDIYDRPLLSLVSGISHQQLQRVVLTGSSLNSVFITIGADRFVANLVPVRISDGSIVGGVLSCDEVDRIETVSADIRREQRRLRHPAIHDFQTWPCRSPQMKQLREEAERFALSDAPILLRYEPGCYPQVLAEAIHNASERREMPFVSMDCAETSPQEQLERLFGYGESGYDVARSLCALAHTGTLYLQKPEFLCPQAQNRLRRLLTQNVLENTASASPYPLDLRLIAATEATAEEWAVLDGFDRELRFLMSGLVLRFPALREMPEEIEYSYPLYLNRYLKKYQRYLSVTKGGHDWFLRQPWPGNYIQLDRFCERLVLSAPRRSIDERLLSDLMQEVSPAPVAPPASAAYPNEEAQRIAQALAKNLGRRQETAQDLGISVSTLWRKIKKYHIGV